MTEKIEEKKKISGVILLFLVMSVMFLAGCGSARTVEKYFSDNQEAMKQIEQMEKNSTDENGSLKFEVKENTVTITYQFKETYTGKAMETMKQTIDEIIKTDDMSSYTDIIKDIKEDAGIEEEVTIKVVYLNGDGEELGLASIKK